MSEYFEASNPSRGSSPRRAGPSSTWARAFPKYRRQACAHELQAMGLPQVPPETVSAIENRVLPGARTDL